MRFPQTFIDDLSRQADIVRIISDYVSIKKKGANWSACCPFHGEKTPSFSVNPAKAMFYCFGCQKGGNVFGFVMEIERVSFPEAIKIVAEKTGMPLPHVEDPSKFEAKQREGEEIFALNSWAFEWWEEQLRGDGAEAKSARAYVSGRNIADETSQAFRLGFAPSSWDGLTSHLKKRGASPQQIERSGLVVKKETGGFYDRFRGRIIFPVLDLRGRPVAFGGRVLPSGGEPKYLNSPETPVYTKGRHLFGLHLAGEEIKRRRFAILVEGYLDLIMLYQYGIRNAVASLGTALTGEQAKLLGRFARKVVVNYDGDKAGVAAAKRAVETLLAEDLETKVLVLPDNADPDDFIRTHGVDEYHRRRGEALPAIHFTLEQAVRDRDLGRRPSDKRDAVEEVLPLLRAVKDKILKREYFDIAMDTLRVELTLRNDCWQSVRAGAPAASSRSSSSMQKRAADNIMSAPQATVAEQRLLEILVHDEEIRHTILPRLEPSDYQSLTTASIFDLIKKTAESGETLDSTQLSELAMRDPVAEKLVPLILLIEPPRHAGDAPDEVLAEAESCLVALQLMGVDRRLQELAAEMAAAERAGDHQQRDRTVIEHLHLTRRRNTLLPRQQVVAAHAGS